MSPNRSEASRDDKQATQPTVLVVDDNPGITRAFGRLLSSNGYRVVLAANGRQALNYLRDYPITTALLDVNLPDVPGLELLLSMRATDPDLPVVLVTGEPTIETAVQAVEYGAVRYLIKPVESSVLLETLEHTTKLAEMAGKLRIAAAHGFDRDNRTSHVLRPEFNRSMAKLWMAYQPLVDTSTGAVIGHEALVRSRDSRLNQPSALFDYAERLGRLRDLGRTIREHVAAQAAVTQGDGLFFVNLHPFDLNDGHLLAPEGPLTRFARRVVLEITERAALEHVASLTDRVAQLRRLGYRIAIDDLGSGHAGLSTFVRLNPEFVKFDMPLIREIQHSSARRRLLAALTHAFRSIGVTPTAEGVETLEECEVLRGIGCSVQQGRLFAAPGPAFPEVTLPPI